MRNHPDEAYDRQLQGLPLDAEVGSVKLPPPPPEPKRKARPTRLEQAHKTHWDATATQSGNGHMCNCVGCCPLCKGCITAPWHARIYKDVQQINKMLARIRAGESLWLQWGCTTTSLKSGLSELP